MPFNYLDNMELEEALDFYMAKLGKSNLTHAIEEIPSAHSLGRTAADAVYARISSPHYNACAMDGIAVCARATFSATDTSPLVLKEGVDFVRVDTGDALPENFDAVIMIEDIIEAGEDMVKILESATPWQHIRQIGEDICAGEMILPSNTVIRPAAIGAMLAGAVLKVRVKRKLLAGIIPTGNEIVHPTDSPKEGEIIEFNSHIFSAMLDEWGVRGKTYAVIPDQYELIKNAVAIASGECDLVLLNAGSSAGREDFSASVIASLGEVLVHGIAIRPGKPTILGLINGKPVIGIPGYPVSGIIVMEKIVKLVIGYISNMTFDKDDKTSAILVKKLVSSLKYKEYVRVKLGMVDGRLTAVPLHRGAGVITSFIKADGILEIPQNSEGYEAGSSVDVYLLKKMDEIKNTMVLIGSHDPLIDVISDMFRRQYPAEFVSSANVGSMGGIMAIKRGESHAAGIHLLDEETGEYNTGYIKHYLAGESIILVKGVKRMQGFMTAPGNPLKISGLSDICSVSLKYVNRQKGSGTRILLDYLLKKSKIDPVYIYGYDREEFTHMSVAALIASGSADTGMGIFSAAGIYGLDFIPVCEEEFDFIIPERYLKLKMVSHFIEILLSDDFKKALDAFGGYVTDESGNCIEVNS